MTMTNDIKILATVSQDRQPWRKFVDRTWSPTNTLHK